MIYLAGFFGWNAFVYLLYGLDKWKAKRGAWRIPEFWLILLAFLMGSLGAVFGMLHFNHKTKKMKFRLLVPLAFVVNVGVAVLVYYYIKNGWSVPSVFSRYSSPSAIFSNRANAPSCSLRPS